PQIRFPHARVALPLSLQCATVSDPAADQMARASAAPGLSLLTASATQGADGLRTGFCARPAGRNNGRDSWRRIPLNPAMTNPIRPWMRSRELAAVNLALCALLAAASFVNTCLLCAFLQPV